MAEDTVVGVKHFAEQACAASSVMPVLPAMPAVASLTSGKSPLCRHVDETGTLRRFAELKSVRRSAEMTNKNDAQKA